jgi:hypothetical protein
MAHIYEESGWPKDPYDPIYRKITTAEEEKELEQQKIRSEAFMKNYWEQYHKDQARAAKAYAARKEAEKKKKEHNEYQAAGNNALAATYGNSTYPQDQKGGRKTRKSSKRRFRRKSRNRRL